MLPLYCRLPNAKVKRRFDEVSKVAVVAGPRQSSGLSEPPPEVWRSPETLGCTGAKDRLDESPIEIDEASDPIGADLSQLSGQDDRRASSKGFLNLTLEFYLDLLDWAGRNIAAGNGGVIPDHLEPILQRIGIVSSGWCDLIQQLGRLFKRAVRSPQALATRQRLVVKSNCMEPRRPSSYLVDFASSCFL